MAVKVGLKYIDIWGESMEDAIVRFEKEQVDEGQIVFYGPSNFTRWSSKYGIVPLRDAIKGVSGKPCIVNRGFGSSCAEHQLYYYPRAIRPIKPSVLVYSCNGNGSSFGYSLEESWELGQRVVSYAMTDFPGIHIYLCSVGPRLEDYNFTQLENNNRFNQALKSFCETNPNCHYIDIMKYEGMHRKDIFVEDGVHFNQAGYDEYTKVFTAELAEELKRF